MCKNPKTLQRNPSVILYDNGQYVIRFVTGAGRVLNWVQDLSEPKLKDLALVNLPIIRFPSRSEAEDEVRKAVIPYLTKKGIDVVGW